MKIIGGKYAGFIIRPPKALKARPTTSIAKESLFNILNNRYHFKGLNVLDLFTGSGGIGLEFASREAENVTAVDFSGITNTFLKQVIEQLELTNFTPIKGEVIKYLQNTSNTYDIIFADPPYGMQNIDEIITTVFKRDLLTEIGVLIVEHDRHVRVTQQYLQENRKYGHSSFSFYSL